MWHWVHHMGWKIRLTWACLWEKLIRLGREVNALNCKQACWIV